VEPTRPEPAEASPGARREAEQRAVVAAPPGQHLCVLAGPGAGKTHVLVDRVAALAASGVPAERLALVTYTNSARDELRARLRLALGAEAGARPFVGTLHQLCAELLRRAEPAGLQALGLPARPRILEPDSAARLFALCCDEADPQTADRRFEALSLAWCRWDGLGPRPPALLEGGRAWETYAQAMRRDGLACFGLLQLWALEAVEAGLAPTPHTLWVDEYQDTSGLQARLLSALARRGAWVGVVGDPDQAVFAFAGADASQLPRFAERFAGAELLRLSANARALPALVALAGRLRRGPPQFAVRQGSARPRLVRLAGEEQQARAVAGEIERLIREQGLAPGDVAALCREGLPVALARELGRRGLPFWAPREERPEARPHLRALVLALEALGLPEDPRVQFLFFDQVVRGSARTWAAVLAELDGAGGLEAAVERALGKLARPRQASLRAYLEARAQLARLAAQPDPAERVRELHRAVLAPRLGLAPAERADEVARDVERAAGLAAELAPEELGARLRAGALAPEQAGGRVTLASLHHAKGREWAAVFLLDLTQGVLPHRRAEDEQEERRLLFVGLSRARDHLWLCAPERLPGRGEGPSRFLEELADGCELVDLRAR